MNSRDNQPNFMVVGAAKSGTTSLCNYLAQHPQVFVTNPKEPHFFVKEKPIGKTVRTWEEYLELYDGAEKFQARGEGSVGYLYCWEEASARIKEFLPSCKIIIILRNPIERAYSMYWHNVRDGRENLSFEEALQAEEMRVRHCWEMSYHYTRLGFTAKAVEHYFGVFGRDNVHVVVYESFLKNMKQEMMQTFKFLGVDEYLECDYKHLNKSGMPRNIWLHGFLNGAHTINKFVRGLTPMWFRIYVKQTIQPLNMKKAPEMNVETRDCLASLYEKDVHLLSCLLGCDLSGWLAHDLAGANNI